MRHGFVFTLIVSFALAFIVIDRHGATAVAPLPLTVNSRASDGTRVAGKCMPAVVHIRGKISTNFGTRPVSGSGVLVRPDGYVLTCSHVITGVSGLTVVTRDGVSYSPETLIDEPEWDLAVLKIHPREQLPFLRLASSPAVLGERVFILGSPQGFPWSVTAGIVSNHSTTISLSSGDLTEMVMTDAPINPGNSGGPMVTVDGEVVGVATAYRPDGQSMGWACPLHRASKMVERAIALQAARRALMEVR